MLQDLEHSTTHQKCGRPRAHWRAHNLPISCTVLQYWLCLEAPNLVKCFPMSNPRFSSVRPTTAHKTHDLHTTLLSFSDRLHFYGCMNSIHTPSIYRVQKYDRVSRISHHYLLNYRFLLQVTAFTNLKTYGGRPIAVVEAAYPSAGRVVH